MNQVDQPGNALAVQVGGTHYKDMPIQPAEFSLVNALNTNQANILKYVCRHRQKGGLQDLEKGKHYGSLWIDLAEVYGLDWRSWDVGIREVIGVPFIRVETFIEVNELPHMVADTVRLICNSPSPLRVRDAQALITEMQREYAV